MPNLIGLDYESIKNSAEYKDFNLVIKESGYKAQYPVGQIYDQSRPKGAPSREGPPLKSR